jgi:carbon dioxide concentrating mechanism protein CcmN
MSSSSPLFPEPNDFTVSGDVIRAPSAAIAPGVLLQADPDSQIVIGAGVCIGLGAILHAHGGLLEIQVGTTIGAGVLIFGSGEIGVNACIGSGSTLIDPAIKAEQVVASGSLLGDNSRQLNEETPSTPSTPSETPTQPEATESAPPPHSVEPVASDPNSSPPSPPSKSADEPETPKFTPPIIYGRANLDQLLDSLLPHRKSHNNNSQPKPGEISKMGEEQTE